MSAKRTVTTRRSSPTTASWVPQVEQKRAALSLTAPHAGQVTSEAYGVTLGDPPLHLAKPVDHGSLLARVGRALPSPSPREPTVSALPAAAPPVARAVDAVKY